jgi:(p)ppGpp synthase/HD superfamily hydrolase
MASEKTEDFNLSLAIQVSLLHDVLEDTNTTFDEIAKEFSLDVAEGVQSLTQNDDLPKEEKMMDSLNRIKKQPKETQAVKLADRITNLQEPPKHWPLEKIQKYKEEAILILEHLKDSNLYLANRLRDKITAYGKYCEN